MPTAQLIAVMWLTLTPTLFRAAAVLWAEKVSKYVTCGRCDLLQSGALAIKIVGETLAAITVFEVLKGVLLKALSYDVVESHLLQRPPPLYVLAAHVWPLFVETAS